MLNENFLTKGAVEVNSLSEEGLTPLDVLLMVQTDTGDRDIEEKLRRAVAIRSRDLHQGALNQNQVVTTNNSLPSGQSSLVHCFSPYKHVQNYFKYNKNRDSPSKIRNYLLVIAVLIATGTYQAVLSPPGGVWQDDLPNNNSTNTNTNTTTPTHIAGQAVMGTHRPVTFALFLVFNSIGFFMSVHMICFLTIGFPLQLELQVSVVALIATYNTSMTAISPGDTSLVFTILSILLPFVVPIASKVIRDLRIPKYVLPRTNQASAESRSANALSC